MPDTIAGVKTGFANWKMIARITKKLADDPDRDDPVFMEASLVYVFQATSRIILAFNKNIWLNIVINFLQKMSREVIAFIIDWLLKNKISDFIQGLFIYGASYTDTGDIVLPKDKFYNI